ncbi:MAG: ISL3 family transposase [Ktedonobacterales bacterium]|nr:ISL3 family transposase [Ktedonobacterales bacterium]
MDTILPDPTCFALQKLRATAHEIVAVVCSTQTTSACPLCQRASSQVHSHYQRTLLDLPWQGITLRLELHVRRWRCADTACPRRIFTERFATSIMPYARRTDRLTTWFTLVGLALGGKPGARLLQALGLVAKPDTLLRHIRSLQAPARAPLTHIGVDEFAFRRGRVFGTIIVDLLSHRVVDLLPDCEPATVSRWLAQHPEIVVVSRDRAINFGEAIRRGAPQAQQVADRWHLLENLAERLETWFRDQARPLRTAHDQLRDASPTLLGRSKAEEAEGQAEQARQRQRYEQVQQFKAQGCTAAAIARHLGVSRQTVYRYLAMTSSPPRRRITPPQTAQQRHTRRYVEQRWAQGCHNAVQMWRDLKEQGHVVGFRTVSRWVTLLRKATGIRGYRSTEPSPLGPPSTSLTPRRAARLCLKDPAHLRREERQVLADLLGQAPEIQTTYDHVQAFGRMVRTRSGQDLDAWLVEVEQRGCAPLRAYAAGLRKDDSAVRAGLTLPYSQGVVEGNVHRLKLIKRSGYGKMGLATLRQRVVLPQAS